MRATERIPDEVFRREAAALGFGHVADALLAKRASYQSETTGDDEFVGRSQPLRDLRENYTFYRSNTKDDDPHARRVRLVDHFLWKYATDTMMDFAFNLRTFEQMGSPTARQLNRALVMPSSAVNVLTLLVRKVEERFQFAIRPTQLVRETASLAAVRQSITPPPPLAAPPLRATETALVRDFRSIRIALLQTLDRGVLWPESAVQIETRTLAFFGGDYDLQCRLMIVPFNQTKIHYWSAVYLYDEVLKYVAVFYFDSLPGLVRDSERFEKLQVLNAAFRYAGCISPETPIRFHGCLPIGEQADGRTCGIQHVLRAHALVASFADHGEPDSERQPVTVQRLLQHRLVSPAIPADMRVVFSPDVCRDELYRHWRFIGLLLQLFPKLEDFPELIENPDSFYRQGEF
jgi:hypothetical protein